MARILLRLTALCMLSAFSEQMTSGSAARESVRLIVGLIASEMVLEMVLALPGALLGGG